MVIIINRLPFSHFIIICKFSTHVALRTHLGTSLALSTVYDTHVPAMNASTYEVPCLPPRYRPPSIHPLLYTLTATTFSPELLLLSLNCPPHSSSSCKPHHQLDLCAFHSALRCTRFLARSRALKTHLNSLGKNLNGPIQREG